MMSLPFDVTGKLRLALSRIILTSLQKVIELQVSLFNRKTESMTTIAAELL